VAHFFNVEKSLFDSLLRGYQILALTIELAEQDFSKDLDRLECLLNKLFDK
jgi:hypothetical protein